MEDITKEYLILFNGITETIVGLEDHISRLKQLQEKAEMAFIEEADKKGTIQMIRKAPPAKKLVLLTSEK